MLVVSTWEFSCLYWDKMILAINEEVKNRLKKVFVRAEVLVKCKS